ncbi:AAA family ATPase [Chryseosolibacter indicus]|uniref:AAA family ATPase n=1 Tax=Chryseosolibacter indicus TaxID=2782351 RepID=A0ABS5VXC6_9BACT|nr:AAA family ATPase [Chryseosolibacter indicus]MBT1705713.1 AAA family ATPase [Chryseosolibacter indicus]
MTSNVYNTRHKVYAGRKSSIQLDTYVQQMFASGNGSLRGVLISGNTGTGKTFFIESYLERFEGSSPLLIARHYQQHQNIPYFGFKYCISDYLSKVYNRFNKAELQDFAAALKSYLGETFLLLADYIPELSLIFGKESVTAQYPPVTIENQLYPLFKKLFEFLAHYYKRPVLFFTDDLQWIDASGINLLKYLLISLSTKEIIWIGACRTYQNKSLLLHQFAEELHFCKIQFEGITLKGLDREEAKLFTEMTLSGKCHGNMVDLCYSLTEGNPSHLQALLESLRKSELIWLDEGVWSCDVSAVSEQFSGLKAERILWTHVRRLSFGAYSVLCIIACMGRFDRGIILDWMGGDEQKLKSLLNEAGDAGLIEFDENEVRFSEMQIGEMIYNKLSDARKLEIHYTIANLFYSRGLENLSSTEIVLMATSFNNSLDKVRRDQKQLLSAQLNYEAGKISLQDKASDQARYFFKMSAELLKECDWDQVYELAWSVHMDRARLEYILGEYDLAEIHLDYLLERTSDPIKRSKVFELKVTINNHLGRYQKGVWILKEGLAELGLELPLDEQILHLELTHLKRSLNVQEEGPHSNMVIEDGNHNYKDAVLKLLYVGGMSLHHTSDVLMTWAALQIILRSGRTKISVVKAIGYVSYGRMLIISGDIEKGFEYGVKGLKINGLLSDISLRCRVFGVYAFYIQPWKKPFADSYKLLDEAADAGRKAGDLIGVYILKTHHLNLHFISGLSLTSLLQMDFEESYPGMELTYYITHYQKSLIRFLTGDTEVFSIPRQNPPSLAARLTIQEEKFYRNYVWGRYYFLFGYYELAARASEEAHDNCKLQEGSPLLPANLLIWFLSVTQNWLNYSSEKRNSYEKRVTEVLHSFRTWRQYAPQNYEGAWLLMNAEWNRVQDNDEEASIYYQKSLDASGSNIYHRAVTNELWGKYLLSVYGSEGPGLEHLLTSIESFREWGASAKVEQLLQQYAAIVSDGSFRAQMDIETLQYELSGDLEVGSLVKKLMVLLLRISGSTQVVLELVEDKGQRILYDSLSLLNYPRGRTNLFPTSMILMALKSQHTIIVNDSKGDRTWREHESIQMRGVKSFMILPVTLSDQLSMVVYLENTFAKNWYTNERVKAIRIGANQGAIILENARIHERSLKLNDELRKEMQERERLSSLIDAQKDAHLKAVVQAQDNERKRIASDLHDSLGSLLSSVRLRFNGLQHDFEVRIPEKATRYNDTLTLLDEAIAELRQVSHRMVPVSLSRFGLKSALETFVEQIQTSEQLEIDLQVLGYERKLCEDLEVAVYRICQELVQNVIKHAQATMLRIQVIQHDDCLNLIVEDNGIGIKKDSIFYGLGLSTIQSKVNLFHGTFGMESQPGKGMQVLIDFPLEESTHCE